MRDVCGREFLLDHVDYAFIGSCGTLGFGPCFRGRPLPCLPSGALAKEGGNLGFLLNRIGAIGIGAEDETSGAVGIFICFGATRSFLGTSIALFATCSAITSSKVSVVEER